MVQVAFDEKSRGAGAASRPDVTPKLGVYVYLLGTAAVIGGFLFGYDTGIVSSAMLYLPEVMDLDYFWQEMIVSSTLLGCAVFSLIAGPASDRFGRRPVILAASGLFAVGAGVMAASQEKYMLLVGRLIVGAAIGLASMVVPVYVSESCPVHIRGLMVTGFQLMITFGIFCAAFLGACFSYIDPKHVGWRLMLGFAAVPGIIQFVCFLFLPESPRFLATHGRETEAREVLRKIYSNDEAWVKSEMDEILEFEEQTKAERAGKGDNQPTFITMLKTPHVRKMLLFGCSLQMFGQLGGINTLMYYTATIVKMGGIRDPNSAIWVACIIGGVNFVFTFVPIYLVEKLGRRKLLLLSMIGVIFSLVVLGVGFLLINNDSAKPAYKLGLNDTNVMQLSNDNMDIFKECRDYNNCDNCVTHEKCGFCYYTSNDTAASYGWCLPTSTEPGQTGRSLVGPCMVKADIDHNNGFLTWADNWCVSQFSWLPIIGMVLYLSFFSIGMGPMPWVYNSEIYPNWARSTGASITTATQWVFNIVISLTFLSLTELITKYGAFFLYGSITIVGLIIFFFVLPETKGIPIEEVEKLFMNKQQRLKHEQNQLRIHKEHQNSLNDKF